MKLSHRFVLVILLALAGATLSYLLLLQHHGEQSGKDAVAQVCGPGEDTGCDKVNRSPYAKVAGFPLAGIGLIFYLSLGTLALFALLAPEGSQRSTGALLLALVGLALLVDLVLLGLQAFSIGAYCTLCLLTYAVNVAALVLLLVFRPDLPSLKGLLAQPEARTLGVAWIVATAAFAFGACGTERALAEREARRSAFLPAETPSGDTPEPAATPAATAAPPEETPTPATAEEQVKALQKEVKRLKGILDDPHKFEEYTTTKNLNEFARAGEQMIDLTDSPVKGLRDAPIKVAEYADYLCPFCRQLDGGFQGYVPQTQGRVAVFYKFFPLDSCNPSVAKSVHPGACLLAQGAVCAIDQKKFAPFHGRILGTELKDPGREEVLKLAREAGLDEASFATCLESERAKGRVLKDINEGIKAGVKATPTIFINGKRLPRAQPADIVQAVEMESQRLGLGPMPQPKAHEGGAHGPNDGHGHK
jgi:uncharacterized membrane protein/protein-disulfide isomerase